MNEAETVRLFMDAAKVLIQLDDLRVRWEKACDWQPGDAGPDGDYEMGLELLIAALESAHPLAERLRAAMVKVGSK